MRFACDLYPGSNAKEEKDLEWKLMCPAVPDFGHFMSQETVKVAGYAFN